LVEDEIVNLIKKEQGDEFFYIICSLTTLERRSGKDRNNIDLWQMRFAGFREIV